MAFSPARADCELLLKCETCKMNELDRVTDADLRLRKMYIDDESGIVLCEECVPTAEEQADV